MASSPYRDAWLHRWRCLSRQSNPVVTWILRLGLTMSYRALPSCSTNKKHERVRNRGRSDGVVMMTSFLSRRRRAYRRFFHRTASGLAGSIECRSSSEILQNVKPETRVDLSPFGPASYVLSNIDMRAGEIMLARNAEFMVLGTDGQVRSKMDGPADVEVQPSTFRRLGDGWVGWDAYRDEGPYQVSWSLPAGKGNHHVLKGRLINSVAVSPAGDLIAISVGTALNIGNIQDSIYVLRAMMEERFSGDFSRDIRGRIWCFRTKTTCCIRQMGRRFY